MHGELTRRDFVTAAAAGLVLGGATMGAERPEPDLERHPWIDAHSHIWPPEVDKYPLVKGLTKQDLKPASFTDDELLAVAHAEKVGRVVLIQHSIYHLFDNSYLVDATKKRPKTFRIVGMVDDRGADPGKAMRELLPKGVTGFRITPFIRPEGERKNWLDNSGMKQMWKTGAATGQAMCCLIGAGDLPGVSAMCAEFPETPVVIDHFARIGYDGEIREAEIDQLCALAKHRRTAVKVSAYYALGKKQPPHLELGPMIRRLLEAFGPERLMWASDSPYQLEGGNNYAASIGLIRDRLDFLSAGDKEWLLRKTAERVFQFS